VFDDHYQLEVVPVGKYHLLLILELDQWMGILQQQESNQLLEELS
jgi:hypothetical protein